MVNSYSAQLENIRTLLGNFLQVFQEDKRVILSEPGAVQDVVQKVSTIKNEIYLLEIKLYALKLEQ